MHETWNALDFAGLLAEQDKYWQKQVLQAEAVSMTLENDVSDLKVRYSRSTRHAIGTAVPVGVPSRSEKKGTQNLHGRAESGGDRCFTVRK